MKKNSFGLLQFSLILAIVFGLSACGGSNSSDTGTSSGQSGSIGVLLTDMPADPDEFLAVNITIESIELIGGNDDNQGKETIYSGPSTTINLLDLKNESMPFSFQDGIPVGDYCKIRLILSDLELVLADDTPDDDSDNETAHPKLPGNNKLDLNVRDCFTIEAGQMLVVQLDIDAGKSIHITGNGNKYQFRPVVFVDAVVEEFDPKMLRLTGEYVKYDEEAGTLLLCEALPTVNMSSNGCAEINLIDDSAFFDNVEYAGAPRALDELFVEGKLTSELTVVGWPHYIPPPAIDIEIPDGHIPGSGDCIVWDVRLEPGLQSAPIDCDDVPDEVPAYFVVVDENGLVLDPNRPLISVDALVIEYGEFLQVDGIANAAADSTGVEISVAPGSPIVIEDLDVMFQEGEVGVNGTRFVSKAGTVLDYDSILENSPLQIDGVVESMVDADDILKAALVIIDFASITDDAMTGEITTVDAESALASIDSEELCGVMATQLEIDLSTEFELLTVTITDEGSSVTTGGTFEVGNEVGANGSCDGTAFQPTSVVIVDDQRTEV